MPLTKVRRKQVWLGWQDDIRGFATHFLLDQGDGHARHETPKALEATQHGAIKAAKETGNSLHVEDVRQLIGNATVDGGAKGLVSHFHKRCLVLRMTDHAVEFCLLATFLWRLEFLGTLDKQSCNGDCSLSIGGSLVGSGQQAFNGEHCGLPCRCWDEGDERKT